MIPEAPLERTESGLVPKGDGWFVLNAREARWGEGDFGVYTRFEGEPRFQQLGINIGIIWPGQPSCMYHREDEQEDFFIAAGECLLLVDGDERPLKAWDFVHCPRGTEHVFVGAGDGPCVLVGIGSRTGGDVVYPVADVALRHSAGVEQETADPKEAYSRFRQDADVAYRDGWLP